MHRACPMKSAVLTKDTGKTNKPQVLFNGSMEDGIQVFLFLIYDLFIGASSRSFFFVALQSNAGHGFLILEVF
jgi:hypothetical protein